MNGITVEDLLAVLQICVVLLTNLLLQWVNRNDVINIVVMLTCFVDLLEMEEFLPNKGISVRSNVS